MHVRTEKWLFRCYENGKVMQVLLKYATNKRGNYRLRDTRHSSHMGSEASCREKTFPLFSPSFQTLSGTNDTSIESPYNGHSESEKKLGVASKGGHSP